MADNREPDVSKNVKISEADQKKKNKKILIIIGSVVGVLIVLSVLGSILAGFIFKKAGTKLAEKVFEETAGAEVDIKKNGGEVRVKGKNGESTFSSGDKKLPDNFPKFIPLYPKAKIQTTSSFNSSGEGEVFSVGFLSKDSESKVFDFYKNELSENNGYEAISTQQSGEISMFQTRNVSQARTVGVTISANKDEGGSIIQLTSTAIKE